MKTYLIIYSDDSVSLCQWNICGKTYILLDVLVGSIAVYFYELCCILTGPMGLSKYKQQDIVQIYSDTTHQNI